MAYHHFFFSKGCAWDVCQQPHLPSLWLGSHSDYSPTAPAAPPLGPLILSSSVTRCELVQVYHHHPCTRVLLDPVYHIIYPGDYPVLALSWGLELGWLPFHAGWAIEPHIVTLTARAVGQSVVMHFHPVHWPASGVGRHNCGCCADGPLNLSHDERWVVPCQGVPQTAGHRTVRVLFWTLA
jgi:hypothetical protein